MLLGSADPSPAVATTSTVSRGKKRGFESTTEGDTAQSDVVQGDLEAVTGRADEGMLLKHPSLLRAGSPTLYRLICKQNILYIG